MANRRGWRLAAGAAAALGLLVGIAGCAALGSKLPNVALSVAGPEASPPALGPFEQDPPITTAEEWALRRAPLLQAAFLQSIYGALPADRAARVVKTERLAQAAFGGRGVVDQIEVALGEGADAPRFHIVLVAPKSVDSPAPLIIAQNFCGNVAALPGIEGVAAPLTPVLDDCTNPLMRPVVTTIIGRYAFAPPFERLLKKGYATAIFYAGDVVADVRSPALMALKQMAPPGTPEEHRPGAIAAWAWLYSRAIDVLDADSRIDPRRTAIWGHSRNGKAALLAAALDPRIEATIALQAGTAGASLQRNGVGESIASITKSYPHWFSPAYAAFAGREDALPVDQHQLLALIAPRPILIGAARRDAWSDPHGAFRAAQGADPAYRLFGVAGLAQAALREPDYTGRIAFYMRPGLHGVHSRDWAVAIAFLDHWFEPGALGEAETAAMRPALEMAPEAAPGAALGAASQ